MIAFLKLVKVFFFKSIFINMTHLKAQQSQKFLTFSYIFPVLFL